jgi:hypothetical protein
MRNKKYQYINTERAIKTDGLLLKTTLLFSADEDVKALYLESLEQLPPSVEVTTLKTVILHEFQLLELNKKALENQLQARKNIISRMQVISKQLTVLSKKGAK